MSSPIELFYSYSHKDERLRERLEKQLVILKHQGVIAGWHDRKIPAGEEWADQIDEHLNSARVILLLVTADFLASNYCWDIEMKRAMERHEAGEAQVIPIILRPCMYQDAPFGQLQALPRDGRAIELWKPREAGFLNAAEGIKLVCKQLPPSPQKNPLRELLTAFFRTHSQGRWFFNAVRIHNWGSRQHGYEEFAKYSTGEIDEEMKCMLSEGKARIIISGSGNPLYGL